MNDFFSYQLFFLGIGMLLYKQGGLAFWGALGMSLFYGIFNIFMNEIKSNSLRENKK